MSNAAPSLTLEEVQKIVAAKTFPRVTKESIEAKIKDVDYLFFNDIFTICLITMGNGFMVHGVAAPADKRNFDAEVGKRYAYEDAFKKLWQLEGYLLRERLCGVEASNAA